MASLPLLPAHDFCLIAFLFLISSWFSVSVFAPFVLNPVLEKEILESWGGKRVSQWCGLYILAQTGFVKTDLECVHASVGGGGLLLFCFMAVSLPEAQTEIPVSWWKDENLTFLSGQRRVTVKMQRIHCAWGRTQILFTSCSSSLFWHRCVGDYPAGRGPVVLAGARLTLSQRDLSLGAPPALCCVHL